MNDHAFRQLKKLYTERTMSDAHLVRWYQGLVAHKITEADLKVEIERRGYERK